MVWRLIVFQFNLQVGECQNWLHLEALNKQDWWHTALKIENAEIVEEERRLWQLQKRKKNEEKSKAV